MRFVLRSALLGLGLCVLFVGVSAAQEGDEAPAAEPSASAAEAPAQAAAAAPPEPAPPCSSPEHRQFDFWIGSWRVTEPDGTLAGINRIDRLYEGCVLRERWEGASGSVGTSFNLYDAARGAWHQTWVDGRGGLLLLEGGLQGDAMVMRGTRPSREEPGAEVLHEIRWEPLEGGEVRQLWRASTDGGESWRALFEGIYAPMDP